MRKIMTCPDNLLDYYLLQAKWYHPRWYWVIEQHSGALEYNGWIISWDRSRSPEGYYINRDDIELLSNPFIILDNAYLIVTQADLYHLMANAMYMADNYDLFQV